MGSHAEEQASRMMPLWIRIWFCIDMALVLMPPLHWIFGLPAQILGAPMVLIYLFGSSAFICASVMAAYIATSVPRAEG